MRRGEDRACVAARRWRRSHARAGIRAARRERGENAPAGYLAPLRQALIDRNGGHVNVFVCESDYRALKRGIEHLAPGGAVGRKRPPAGRSQLEAGDQGSCVRASRALEAAWLTDRVIDRSYPNPSEAPQKLDCALTDVASPVTPHPEQGREPAVPIVADVASDVAAARSSRLPSRPAGPEGCGYRCPTPRQQTRGFRNP
jgi:hypothetical protein